MDDFKIRATIEKREPSEPSIIHDGVLKIKPSSYDYAKLLIAKLGGYKGGEVQIEISDGDYWSDRMNNLFHALVRKIVVSGASSYWSKIGRAPETFEEVKAFVKIELGGAKVESIGSLTWIESWTKFSKRRAMQTIDSVINWCMENGIDIDAEKLEHENLGGKSVHVQG